METFLLRDEDIKKVLIIGLGQLGLPVAMYVKLQGFDAYGYDLSQKAMQRAEKVASIKSADDFSEFDVYIVCVSTHKPDDMFTPQIKGLLSVVREKIAIEAKNGALVSIESTILRGTSRKVFEMLNHRLHVAHIPHRWYALEDKEHGVNQMRVAGGVCECCLKVAMQFYGRISDNCKMNYNDNDNNHNNRNNRIDNNTNTSNNNNIVSKDVDTTTTASYTSSTNSASTSGITTNSISNSNYIPNLGIPLHPVSDIEIAEIAKIAENAHRYLQIAFAEDMYLYCQASGISFPELREALNTKWNVEILEPREGIGGHCLPKDTKMFLQSTRSISTRSKILKAAIEVDEEYKRYRLSQRIDVLKMVPFINTNKKR
ncbi:MAG: NAD(P)-binding domain-containing protein [Nitrososphaeraceae archaeon]